MRGYLLEIIQKRILMDVLNEIKTSAFFLYANMYLCKY